MFTIFTRVGFHKSQEKVPDYGYVSLGRNITPAPKMS